ncbi:MAG: thiS [Hydrocarboniphaga sp.]|uniref:sulfur carrier protein ThiS n=1 Tax=Hydrocarboniphaga sp. TaxID=2033016 RepID=UPI00261BAC11|nr:sulfur carrier protein ThiS [Hydrocarboniphaga sp.]MDB5972880.1 thiS [Hydrocarboniphaga sp.]
MIIQLNGQPREVPGGCSVLQLIEQQLHLAGKRLAVEVNGEIVPRSQFASALLHAGDHVEVVQAIGGG